MPKEYTISDLIQQLETLRETSGPTARVKFSFLDTEKPGHGKFKIEVIPSPKWTELTLNPQENKNEPAR